MPHVQVRSFPTEPIGPLISDSDGSYIIGGGQSGSKRQASHKVDNTLQACSIQLLSHYPRIVLVSKVITCLAFCTDGVTLVSRSEDCTIRVWNTKAGQITRLLKHAKAPISNILIVRQPTKISQVSLSEKDQQLLIPHPLDKYIDPSVENITVKMPYEGTDDFELENRRYSATVVMLCQIKELQQNASSGAVQMELERLRAECKISMQMAQQWKKLNNDLKTTVVNELLNGNVDSS